MTETLRMEATPGDEETFLYHPQAYECEENTERAAEIMQRRNDLLSRITEDDKAHAALREAEQVKSEVTRETVRQHRRTRENSERQKEGLERYKKEKKAKATPVLDAEGQYLKELEDKYDNPKTKTRKPKAETGHLPEGFIKVEADGPTADEADGAPEG